MEEFMKKEILKLCGNVDKSVDSQAIFQHKKSFFKKLGVSILACFMFCLPLFAGCSSLSQNLALFEDKTSFENGLITNEEVGLIQPKSTDPTIYTTQSGIDIKFGMASLNIENELPSGNLAGFPYFTTTKGAATYTWVIIGRGANTDAYAGEMTANLFSSWKVSGSALVWGNYFFDNIYENTSPAGAAINSATSSKGYIMDYSTIDLTKVVYDEEVGEGCVLVLLNSVYETSHWSSGSVAYGYTCFVGENNLVKNKCVAYYTNDTFGFGNNLEAIQTKTLKQAGAYGNSDPGTVTTDTIDMNFFPLTIASVGGEVSSINPASYPYNFAISTYLTQTLRACGSGYWTRHNAQSDWTYIIAANGAISSQVGALQNGGNDIRVSAGIRPACVIKL